MQLPFVAAQAAVQTRDLPIASSLVTFSQQLGGAIFLAIGETIFSSSLINNLQSLHLGLTPSQITGAGATGIRNLVGANTNALPMVLQMYSQSLQETFRLCIIMGGVSLLLASFVEWKNLRRI
jgi:hypothetical protein